MNHIDTIWQQLEKQEIFKEGISKIRFNSDSFCDLYLGLKTPQNLRLLCLKIPIKYITNFKFTYNFKGLRCDVIYDPDNSNFVLLNLLLLDQTDKEIFNSIILDVINSLIELKDYDLILKNFTNRLTKWQNIFEKFLIQGLLPEAQRGLFGELYFLRKFFQFNKNYQLVLNTWIGSEREVRDFQMNNWALEVKTTHGNNHQKVQISSERQLDITYLDKLFLYHLSLEKVQENGETLNQIIFSINKILQNDSIVLNRFKSKLYESGYFDHHFSLYEPIGYFIRQDSFYLVENDFPRIQENEIRSGVGDVKYSIIISQCENYKQSEETVLKNLTL